ncbi:hypothetical protein GCM10023339_06870 [Alloalcanivorax gelatiniphagus]
MPDDRTSATGPCVLLACYLPSPDKSYVVEEIFNDLAAAIGSAVAYVGIQHGSDASAEEVLRRAAAGWTLHMSRIPERLHVDSDAAAYVESLRLLRESGRRHTLCYFVHTKGVTSGDDDLRRSLLADLTGAAATSALARKGVGSYGPHLTVSRSRDDVALMRRWLELFVDGPLLPALPYFYAHTIWVADGACVAGLLRTVGDAFFITPIQEYSDRYFAERDLPHLVDALAGKRPSYGRLVGNHSTDYHRTRTREYLAALASWYARSAPRRVTRRLGRAWFRPHQPTSAP